MLLRLTVIPTYFHMFDNIRETTIFVTILIITISMFFMSPIKRLNIDWFILFSMQEALLTEVLSIRVYSNIFHAK